VENHRLNGLINHYENMLFDEFVVVFMHCPSRAKIVSNTFDFVTFLHHPIDIVELDRMIRTNMIELLLLSNECHKTQRQIYSLNFSNTLSKVFPSSFIKRILPT